MTFTKEEYLALLEKLANSQYDGDEEEFIPASYESSYTWVPPKPPSKIDKLKKMLTQNTSVYDVTNHKREKLVSDVLMFTNFKVGNMFLRITKYAQQPDSNEPITMDVVILDTMTRTTNGHPCNMEVKVNVKKDSRFAGRPWLKHFTGQGGMIGFGLNEETVADILRWLQAIHKMTAFL